MITFPLLRFSFPLLSFLTFLFLLSKKNKLIIMYN